MLPGYSSSTIYYAYIISSRFARSPKVPYFEVETSAYENPTSPAILLLIGPLRCCERCIFPGRSSFRYDD
jgi:hypothetical protein